MNFTTTGAPPSVPPAGRRYHALIRSPPAPENSVSYTSTGAYVPASYRFRAGSRATARASSSRRPHHRSRSAGSAVPVR